MERHSAVRPSISAGPTQIGCARDMYVGDVLQTPLGDLAVIRATGDRAKSVLQLRDDLATWMLERDLEQWRPGELPLEWIQTCVSEGWVYVVPRGDRVIASVTIAWGDPLMWGDLPEPAGYIHTLMVDRDFAGHGIGRALLAWSEHFIGDSGRHFARLDCVRSNPRLRGYYERAGYALVGYKDLSEVEWAFEAALYEKPLSGRDSARDVSIRADPSVDTQPELGDTNGRVVRPVHSQLYLS